MEELNEDVLDFIESISITTKKETNYLQEVNWVGVANFDDKESEYKLQSLLVQRSVKHAEDFYKLAKADLKHPQVKATLDMLLEPFKITSERVASYLAATDWTKFVDEGKSKELMKREIEFQSDISKDVTKWKSEVRKINYSEDSHTLDIQTFNDTKIPLLMMDIFIERYPEIKDYLKNKNKKKKL
jgi:hypothetical protein